MKPSTNYLISQAVLPSSQAVAGVLGQRHAEVIAHAGGIPVLLDIPIAQPDKIAATLVEKLQQPVVGFAVDITKLDQLEMLRDG